MFFKLFSPLLTSSHLFSPLSPLLTSSPHFISLNSCLAPQLFSPFRTCSQHFSPSLNPFLTPSCLALAPLNFSHRLSTFLASSQLFSRPFSSCLSSSQLFARALNFSHLTSTLFSPLLVSSQLFSTFSTCVQHYPPFPTLLAFRVNSSHLASAFLTFLNSFRLSTFLTATLLASSPLRLSVLNSCQHFCQLLSAFLKSLFTSS